MGTWELVKKPLDAIPIANKWLFVKKTNNIGQIEKYKARLVIKGCSQCPGFDFNETYSPVVRIETVQTILAMVPQMDLKIQQLDIKGAYLNGI
jgi:Reverse transcriptase (RNA-dependent DNA polymerase)